jgi:hypothetical protein
MAKTKQERRIQKEEFFEDFSSLIIEKYYPDVKMFAHHLKIKLNGVEYDYYPGAERICKKVNGVYKWRDLTISEFLNKLQIKENFFSGREVLSTLNIFNGDLN